MTSVVFYFQVHQPFRLGPAAGDRTATGGFAPGLDREVLLRVAERCYRPMNALLLDAASRSGGAVRCGLSVSGTALQQLQAWAPDVLDGFRALAQNGTVELLAETSHHSLSSVAVPAEFEAQVSAHSAAIAALGGPPARTFRNTELVFDNDTAARVEAMGYEVALTEGVDRLLAGRTPHAIWQQPGCETLRTLLRDHRLSDDIGFRFGDPNWPHHPLRAETFLGWLDQRARAGAAAIGVFLDLETFGEHRAADTGVFEFMADLLEALADHPRCVLRAPAEAVVAAAGAPPQQLDLPQPISWADTPRDLSAWLGNPMQREAHQTLYSLYPAVCAADDRGDPELLETWRRLSTSDHLYYMATRRWTDGYVHSYFSPFATALDAFVSFMRTLQQLAKRLA